MKERKKDVMLEKKPSRLFVGVALLSGGVTLEFNLAHKHKENAMF